MLSLVPSIWGAEKNISRKYQTWVGLKGPRLGLARFSAVFSAEPPPNRPKTGSFERFLPKTLIPYMYGLLWTG